MIGKTSSGKGFGGLARYLVHGRDGNEENRAAWVGFRNLAADRVDLATVEMRSVAERAPRVEEPVYHLSLSASPEDSLTREGWERVADRVLRDLGLEHHQAILVAHRDRDHDHVHLVVNRVDPRTLKAWDRWQDQPRIERSLRGLEREMGLREVPGRHFELPGQTRPERRQEATLGERRERDRTGREPWAEVVRGRVREDFQESRSWAELEDRLKEKGLHLEARGRGLVVTDGERQVKASRIVRSGSRGRLEERFGVPFQVWRSQVAELYQKAGQLTKMDGQRQRISDEVARLNDKAQRAKEISEKHRRLAWDAADARSRLARQLELTYRPREVATASKRLDELVRREGATRAASVLRDRPEALGRLQGRGAGPLQDHLRREARDMAGRAATSVEHLGRLEPALAQLAPRAASATRTLSQVTSRIRQVERHGEAVKVRGRETDLGQDLARLAARMGWQAVRLVLPAPVARSVDLAVRIVSAAHDLARDLGRDLER